MQSYEQKLHDERVQKRTARAVCVASANDLAELMNQMPQHNGMWIQRGVHEGCTLFSFLAEHRGSAHGPPRHSTAISTAFHGQPRTLHGLPRTFHGLPRKAAASSETSWRPMALPMAISTAISTATPGERPTATPTDLSTDTSVGVAVFFIHF